MKAQRIGIREAKSRLGRLVDDVRAGAEWIITHRGRPVARLVPVRSEHLSPRERLAVLERDGAIAPANPSVKRLPPPLPLDGDLAQRYLQQDRAR